MKKFLLFVFSLVLSTVVFSQASCPVMTKFAIVNDAGCNKHIEIEFYNPTSGNKWISIEANCGGVITSLGCFDASKQQDVRRNIVTGSFACCSLNDLTVTVTSWTGNSCGGSLCATQKSVGGSPLPVSLQAFTAARNKSSVALSWKTASESNNKGFNIQRNTKGVWETVAFVFSAANGGNSSSDLSYSYNDANSNKGVSQYRLQQVDIDGRSKLSEIRSVRGEEMSSRMLVFPNPSNTGNVSLVFEDASVKTVRVSDMSGRVVRQLKNVSNSASIEGLENGVYSIQVTDLSSAAVSVEKVIIKKR